MTKIIERKERHTFVDEDGNEKTSEKSTSTKIAASTEPDYIKIYTNMWCEFNEIPKRWRELFWQLAIRMTYCNITDSDQSGGQIVYTGKPVGDSICMALGWKTEAGKSSVSLMKGLKALCKCNAIKKINKAVYQINPEYASKGEWKYNPRYDRGGVEDLVATFKFKDKKVETNIEWADDGSDNNLNDMYRKALGVKPKDNAVLRTLTATPKTAETPKITGDVPF